MLAEVARVLDAHNGTYICVTLSQPHVLREHPAFSGLTIGNDAATSAMGFSVVQVDKLGVTAGLIAQSCRLSRHR